MGATVVCGIDPNEDAFRRPLRVAADLARRLGRPLVVAHVAPSDPVTAGHPALGTETLVPAPAPALPYPYPVAPEGPELEKLRDQARRRVERLADDCGIHSATIEVTLDNSAADGLRRIAQDRDAELLVVGSRGRGTLRAALLGSTSHALATDAPCPVVVVPPSD
jgi:nucleotide-binding universal stress UspA family protein